MISVNVMTVMTDAWGTVTIVPGILYAFQILAQVRLYGIRRWWELGLGTGKPVHQHGTQEDGDNQ